MTTQKNDEQWTEAQKRKQEQQKSTGLDEASKATLERRANFDKKQEELHGTQKSTLADKLVQAAAAGRINIVASRDKQSDEFSIQELINKGADPNFPSSSGLLPLHEAVRNNQHQAIILLLEKGAIINLQEKNTGLTPLQIAIVKGIAELIDLLLAKGANINLQSAYGETPLHTAVSEGNEVTLRKILTLKPNVNIQTKNGGDTPLHIAAAKGMLSIVKTLKEEATLRMDIKNNQGYLAIHSAAANNKGEVIDFLIKNGFDINSKTHDNKTILTVATMFGAEATVKRLIELGANPTLIDNDKKSPLDYAKKVNIISILKKETQHRETIEIEQAELRQIEDDRKLSTSKAELDFDWTNITKIIVQGKKLDQLNEQGTSCIHVASAFGFITTVKKLVEDELLKIDINLIDKCGNSALHAAITPASYLLEMKEISENDLITKKVTVSTANSLSTLKYLIQAGANLRVINNAKLMPIHLAVINGHKQAIQEMYNKDSSIISATGEHGMSPLHYAALFGKNEIVAMLCKEMNVDANKVDDRGLNALILADDKLKFGTNLSVIDKDNLKAIIKLFVDLGVNFSAPKLNKVEYSNSVFIAAENGDFDAVKSFIKYGFDPDTLDNRGHKISYYAEINNHKDLANYLHTIEKTNIQPSIINSEERISSDINQKQIEIEKLNAEEEARNKILKEQEKARMQQDQNDLDNILNDNANKSSLVGEDSNLKNDSTS